MIRKICIVTGSRAEYGLMKELINLVNIDDELDLSLIITGSHLSKKYGHTIKEIIDDGYTGFNKVPLDINSAYENKVSKSIGMGLNKFSKIFESNKPNILLICGDRYEILSAALSAFNLGIPVAHIGGGDITWGSLDDSYRHSITKFSHIHFPSNKNSMQIIKQLGEDPKYIFNVGAPGVEAIKDTKIFKKKEIEKELGIRFKQKNLLITFHPVTNETNSSKKYLFQILKSLSNLEDTLLIFTKANADYGGLEINSLLEKFHIKNKKNSHIFSSLGHRKYLSILSCVDGVIGNSSSGIIEAPSFKVGTIDIGNRQQGRIKAKSIISCNPDHEEISRAIKKLYTKKFQNTLLRTINPYKKNNTFKNIIKILKKIDLKKINKKKFYKHII